MERERKERPIENINFPQGFRVVIKGVDVCMCVRGFSTDKL